MADDSTWQERPLEGLPPSGQCNVPCRCKYKSVDGKFKWEILHHSILQSQTRLQLLFTNLKDFLRGMCGDIDETWAKQRLLYWLGGGGMQNIGWAVR